MPKLGDALILDALRFPIAQQPILVISSWSSLAVTLEVRLVTREGVMDLPHTTNADRSWAFDEYRIPNWPICLMARQTAGNPRRGQTFIQIALNLGGHRHVILAQDYIDRHHTLSWPPGRILSSIEGPGYVYTIMGTDPAAGAQVSETVPTNARWRLRGIRLTLVTDATVANRQVMLRLDDGANAFFVSYCPVVQAASLTRYYQWGLLLGHEQSAFQSNVWAGSLPDVILPEGARIRTVTDNFAAGDNWGQPQYEVEEWIEE